MNNRQLRGIEGENAVAHWLKKRGYCVLECNYKTKRGEIDLIVSRRDVVAFVEVKYRTTQYFHLSEVITFTKQKRITAAARQYCTEKGAASMAYRFDVALVNFENGTQNITYLENAFIAENE